MDSTGFDEFQPGGRRRANGRPPNEPRGDHEAEAEDENHTRMVILTRGAELTLLVLKLDGESSTVSQSTLNGEAPTTQQLGADEARAEFHRRLREHTKHRGWRVMYDGPPGYDPTDTGFQTMIEALGALCATPAPGESPDDALQHIESSVALSVKGDQLSITGLKTTPTGGKLQSIIFGRDGATNVHEAIMFDRPRAAGREFGETRRRTQASGWTLFHLGQPNYG
jgi:hypothetical protein